MKKQVLTIMSIIGLVGIVSLGSVPSVFADAPVRRVRFDSPEVRDLILNAVMVLTQVCVDNVASQVAANPGFANITEFEIVGDDGTVYSGSREEFLRDFVHKCQIYTESGRRGDKRFPKLEITTPKK